MANFRGTKTAMRVREQQQKFCCDCGFHKTFTSLCVPSLSVSDNTEYIYGPGNVHEQ